MMSISLITQAIYLAIKAESKRKVQFKNQSSFKTNFNKTPPAEDKTKEQETIQPRDRLLTGGPSKSKEGPKNPYERAREDKC